MARQLDRANRDLPAEWELVVQLSSGGDPKKRPGLLPEWRESIAISRDALPELLLPDFNNLRRGYQFQ
ncbi:hypothetical protein [Neomesorhizobium albiziae]|uniref:hypothetical protein n=1 Tax=Neomesorhizobium albiziae TaxID=335020 RepID=UPI00122D00E8|nr:hypothetical protein [Mesorhizobium albiziae]GLS34406.1 hypothetical protein GCM10007937_61210 [Mesorhizobium albiziae]